MAVKRDILAPGADEAYQLRTFGAVRGDAFTILIARTGETVTLDGERHWLVSPRRRSRRLSTAEWGEFLACLHKADFWSLPGEGGDFGLDGMTWAISGRHGKRCHSAARWSPRDGAFLELGSTFLRLAGVEMTGEGGP
jgi:hypothetical protein